MTLPSAGLAKTGSALAVMLLVAACIAASDSVTRVNLFDGRDLENWRQSGAPIWQVTGDEITVSNARGDGILVSREKYADFKLSLEFWVDDRVNSGIFIRCADGDEFTPFSCYEMNIWDNHPKQEFRTGAIVALVAPPLAHVQTVNKWNTYEIFAQGNQFQVRVNGTMTAQLEDDKRSSGYIALQRANDGKVRFRNIVLDVL